MTDDEYAKESFWIDMKDYEKLSDIEKSMTYTSRGGVFAVGLGGGLILVAIFAVILIFTLGFSAMIQRMISIWYIVVFLPLGLGAAIAWKQKRLLKFLENFEVPYDKDLAHERKITVVGYAMNSY